MDRTISQPQTTAQTEPQPQPQRALQAPDSTSLVGDVLLAAGLFAVMTSLAVAVAMLAAIAHGS